MSIRDSRQPERPRAIKGTERALAEQGATGGDSQQQRQPRPTAQSGWQGAAVPRQRRHACQQRALCEAALYWQPSRWRKEPESGAGGLISTRNAQRGTSPGRLSTHTRRVTPAPTSCSRSLPTSGLRVCRTQPQRTGRHDSWTGPKITFGAARGDLRKLIIVAR